jgi:FkbM family methyltransferase
LYGEWEKESLKIWAHLSKNANYILDIGANTGVFSLLAKRQNVDANVYSIEPIDTNFEVLSKNIQKNGFDIHAEKVALSDKEGMAKMFMLKDRLNYMTSVNDNRYAKHPEIQGETEVIEIEVPIKTYSQIQEKYQIPKLDLIKIDVEGHEVEVLKAMYTQLERDKPLILIEVIGDENAVALDSMFKKLKYKFISINEVDSSRVVDSLWDNDHHNFLLCHDSTIADLRHKGLVN